MGQGSSRPDIWKILLTQTNEILEVTTLEELDAMIDRHWKEKPKLLPDEERRYESSIKSYNEAIEKKRDELEKKLKGKKGKGHDGTPNAIPKLHF